MPIRIPQQEVGLGGLPVPGQPGHVNTGVEQLGQALDKTGDKLGAIAEESARRAVVVDSSNLLNELEQEATKLYYDRDTGAFTAPDGKGEKAVPLVDNAYTKLKEKAADIMSRAGSDRSRLILSDKIPGVMAGYQRQGEIYLAKQRRVADIKTVEARQQTALDGLDMAFDDPVERVRLINGPLELMKALSYTKEEYEAAEAKWKQTGATHVLDGYMLSGRYDEAKAFFYGNKKLFGDQSLEAEAKLNELGMKDTAERLSRKIIDESRDKDAEAWADPDKAKDMLKNMEMPSAVREITDKYLDEYLTDEKNRKSNDIDAVYKHAYTAYNTGGLNKISSNDSEWLNRKAPDLWARFLKDDRTKKRQSEHDIAIANLNAKLDFMAKDDDIRAKKPVRQDYAGQGLNETGYRTIEVLQQEAREQLSKNKDFSTREAGFRQYAKDIGYPLITGGQRRKRFDGEVGVAWSDFVRLNSRPPDNNESSKMIHDLLKVNKLPETLNPFDDEEEFQFDTNVRTRGEVTDGPPPGSSEVKPGPHVIDRRRLPDGRTMEKMSDGTTVTK